MSMYCCGPSPSALVGGRCDGICDFALVPSTAPVNILLEYRTKTNVYTARVRNALGLAYLATVWPMLTWFGYELRFTD